MTPPVPQSWACIGTGVDEAMEIDSGLLMSLLEYAEVEEGDDEDVNAERLRVVIESLEAVIDHPIMNNKNNNNNCMPLLEPKLDGLLVVSCQLFDEAQAGGSSSCDQEFSLMDAEVASSSLTDNMPCCWFLEEPYGDQTGDITEFEYEGLVDNSQFCHGFLSEVDDEYTSLWQQGYDSEMYY